MKFWEFADRNNECVGFCCFMLAIVVITLAVTSCDKHNTRVYAANGYEQVQKQGTTDTMWVKKK